MWYIIIGILALIYVLINIILPTSLDLAIGTYIIQPILWICLSFCVIYLASHDGISLYKCKKIRRWEIGRSPIDAAVLIAGFHISLLIIIGLLFGLGKNPHDLSPLGIILNGIVVFSMIISIEMSRTYLIKTLTGPRRNITMILGLVTILIVIIQIPLYKFDVMFASEPADVMKFVGGTIVPLLAMGLFASYLAYIGGIFASLGYIGIMQSFQWFSPILPNFNWALMAMIGTLAPAIGFMIIQNNVQLSHVRSRRKKIKDPALGWMGVAVASILIIFFSFGYLGVQPTVIYSGSMQPTLDVGDIVLIADVPIDDIEEGDIIEYKGENSNIIHRVYEIKEEYNMKSFITKGDANNNFDDPISHEQINGKSIFVIPKLGWVSITIKSLIKELIL